MTVFVYSHMHTYILYIRLILCVIYIQFIIQIEYHSLLDPKLIVFATSWYKWRFGGLEAPVGYRAQCGRRKCSECIVLRKEHMENILISTL